MKKVKFLSIALMGLSLALSGCKKDDKVNAPDSLTGTSWLTEKSIKYGEVEGKIEIEFETATACEMTAIAGAVVDGAAIVAGQSLGTGTYTYAKPKVTVKIKGEEAKGSIEGDKLTLTFDGETIVFIQEKD